VNVPLFSQTSRLGENIRKLCCFILKRKIHDEHIKTFNAWHPGINGYVVVDN